MALLNWDAFTELPGAATTNFEMLCRALIRRHYERYGRFGALASQPGVEFHLKLERNCSLGDPGDWIGWQCRWYGLQPGRSLGPARKRKIVEAIQATEAHLPGLTHWVLWTRYPLTAGDQKWYNGLSTKMKLLQWTSAEVEGHLSGEATILRGTYFGELVLTPEELKRQYEKALAPIQARWQPEVHQVVEAEQILRAPLGELSAWQGLSSVKSRLQAELGVIEADYTQCPSALHDKLNELVTLAHSVVSESETALALLAAGDVEALCEVLAGLADPFNLDHRSLPRRLRAARSPLAPYVTNALAHTEDLLGELSTLRRNMLISLVAVVAEAGNGKTELAVALTMPQGERPAGVLLHGSLLAARGTLNELAKTVVIQGKACESIEALVAALDAAGTRAECRLPLVIDALNEAEDPRNWRPQLASLDVMLKQYPHVFAVCTVRPEFTNDALPPNTLQLKMNGFQKGTEEAVRRYFKYYKINPGDARFYFEMLKHPLTLRLYCEVTNPTRAQEVTVEGMPRTLSALFERYLKQVATRISELSPVQHRFHPDDAMNALITVGLKLWNTRDRSLVKAQLREELDGVGGLWQTSMVRALESNGVLLGAPGYGDIRSPRVTVLYDLLAGHIIAESLLHTHDAIGFAKWLKEADTLTLFTSQKERHPLADDVFRALITLVPRRLSGAQLWQLVEGPLRTQALKATVKLEAQLLDQETVDTLAVLITQDPSNIPDVFDDLEECRSIPTHPLNANFTHRILCAMAVTQRDLTWSEWLRQHQERVLAWIDQMEQRWKDSTISDESHDLSAIWMTWLLTSNVRRLRDLATRALHWYGQRWPERFVPLLAQVYQVNDLYVVERALAAALGVTFALRHAPDNYAFVHSHLPAMARTIYTSFFAEDAAAATTHVLATEYARRIIEIAVSRDPGCLTEEEWARTVRPYPHDLKREWGRSADQVEGRYREGNSPLEFDFENYTLGRLVPGRRNYDYEDADYVDVKERVLWRIHDLGYTLDAFSKIDQVIARGDSSGRAEDGQKVERYGKKYAWIAYHELAGLRMEEGKLGERIVGDFADIDPSFPELPRSSEHVTKRFLGNKRSDTQDWICKGGVPKVTPYLRMESVAGEPGPWLLLDGDLSQEDKELERAIKIHLRALLIQANKAKHLRTLLDDSKTELLWLPEPPSYDGIYAGDLPLAFEDTFQLELILHRTEGKEEVEGETEAFRRNGEPISDTEFSELINDIQNTQRDEHSASGKEQASIKALLDEMKKRGLDFGIVKERREQNLVRKHPFEVIIPVVEGSWPDYKSAANVGWKAVVPALPIVSHCGWRQRPNSFDYEDNDGVLQALYMEADSPNRHLEWQNFTYVKASTLQLYLADHDLRIVWLITGERSRSSDAFHKHWNNSADDLVYYQDYRGILALDDLS